MTRIHKLCAPGIAVVLFGAVALAAVKQAPAPVAPIPAQIVAAKKVFISYSGAEERWYEDQVFTGGLDRTYNEFYAAMKTWGRYEFVNSPADADLIFEIGLTAPAIAGAASEGDTLARKPYDPQFRLMIRDPKTNTLLWAFTEHVQWAILQGNRDRNFEATLNKIIGDLQALASGPAPAPDPVH
jgi:hypothetical protein